MMRGVGSIDVVHGVPMVDDDEIMMEGDKSRGQDESYITSAKITNHPTKCYIT
jgi:hypothetical protein